MARIRRLESDVQDPSSELFTNVRLVLENWTKPYSRPSATPSSLIFFFWMWWLWFRLGEWFTLECLPLAILANQEALLFPVFRPEKHVLLFDAEADFSSSNIDPCSSGPQEWSPKNYIPYEGYCNQEKATFGAEL